ncbi:CCA tRNA nucleotidyltransferase [Deinococcus sp. Marseille-Q6407]|uniref:CCA tRNA nucleotidyltransferase n=1 Tax=Deinococcus sp. Marseille-Q6407 TaxID=2969223 RepID=UPI0021C22A4F|nr:HD domain-containing protein [Deinococcus sp. Marseille-Q6407]
MAPAPSLKNTDQPNFAMPPEPVSGLCAALAGTGCELYLVGGALRDRLLGRPAHDLDLLVRHPDLSSPALETLLRERLAPAPVLGVGESFRVLKVKWAGEWLDLALPSRRESGTARWTSDPRLPLADDLARRDFTVNALALRLCPQGEGEDGAARLYDPFGGQADLAAGLLRATLSAADRLAEDPLRLLRAARFAAQGLTPDTELTAAARAAAPRLAEVAPERLWQEWLKLFAAPHSARGLRWLADTGALAQLVPAWSEVDGLEQHNPHHSETVSEHLLSVVEKLDRMSAAPLARQAGFFHDIGKGRTRRLDRGPRGILGHFYGHEKVGAELTRQSLRRLRADQRHIRDLGRLVELHMRPGQAASPAAARRLAAAAGDLLEPLLELYAADRLSHVGEDPAQVRERQALIRASAAALPPAFSQHALALSGHELLALGLSPRGVGAAKRWLTEQVLEGRASNERGSLLQLLQQEYLPEHKEF